MTVIANTIAVTERASVQAVEIARKCHPRGGSWLSR